MQQTFSGAQWLSGRVLDSRLRGRGFEPHGHHCVVSLSKNINPSLVLVQPRKTCPFITERLLMGRKESNQTSKKSSRHFQMHFLVRGDELFKPNLISGLRDGARRDELGQFRCCGWEGDKNVYRRRVSFF